MRRRWVALLVPLALVLEILLGVGVAHASTNDPLAKYWHGVGPWVFDHAKSPQGGGAYYDKSQLLLHFDPGITMAGGMYGYGRYGIRGGDPPLTLVGTNEPAPGQTTRAYMPNGLPIGSSLMASGETTAYAFVVCGLSRFGAYVDSAGGQDTLGVVGGEFAPFGLTVGDMPVDGEWPAVRFWERDVKDRTNKYNALWSALVVCRKQRDGSWVDRYEMSWTDDWTSGMHHRGGVSTRSGPIVPTSGGIGEVPFYDASGGTLSGSMLVMGDVAWNAGETTESLIVDEALEKPLYYWSDLMLTTPSIQGSGDEGSGGSEEETYTPPSVDTSDSPPPLSWDPKEWRDWFLGLWRFGDLLWPFDVFIRLKGVGSE